MSKYIVHAQFEQGSAEIGQNHQEPARFSWNLDET